MLLRCDVPGATIVGVARQLRMSPSLIHGWRKQQRDMALLTSEPLQFVPYGEVASRSAAEPAVELRGAEVAPSSRAAAREAGPTHEELIRPNPGLRPGGIDIDLPGGVRLSVDTYVNEKAQAHATCLIAGRAAEEPASESSQPRRQPLPAHLHRQEVLHPAPAADGCEAGRVCRRRWVVSHAAISRLLAAA